MKRIGKSWIIALSVMGMAVQVQAKEDRVEHVVACYEAISEEFKKVSASELTPPVIDELLKEYPTSKLAAVYKNDKGEFKLIMVLQSGTRRTVFIDAHGNWFKMK